jgi:nitrite reductase/ring-hydroxylating ferredoxin subunit
MTEFVHACALSDLSEGKPKSCQVSGKTVTLVKSSDRVFALDAVCPHRGGPLAEGFVQDDCLFCPWHGWGFNLATGDYVGSPGIGVRTHPTELNDDSVMVKVG